MTARTHYYQTTREARPAMDWRAMITQAAFVLALALMASRCMLLETIRDPVDVRIGGGPNVRGAGADTSLVLDLLCCLPAISVLIRRCLDRTYTIRWSLALALIAPLLLWMGLSVRWADDKFTAVISIGNFVAAMALLWAMAQLTRSWMRLRIVAAVAFGLLIVFLVRGFYYKFVDLPILLEQKAHLFQQQGLDPNSFEGIQFARKMGELMGFNSSANSFAGLIVLLMAIGLGVAIQRIKDHDNPGWAVALLLAAPLAMWLLVYTQSKAALVMPVLVVAAFLILGAYHKEIARRAKQAYWVGVAGLALLLAAAIGHGIYHHGLPTSSLNFRWRYWVAAMAMFKRHPLAGVGWENFGPHYLRDRLPAASEEIRDPHNFLVRFLIELGLIGFTLIIAWLGRLWWEMTRPESPPAVVSPLSKSAHWSPVILIASVCGLAVVVNIFASLDLNQNGSYIFVELVNRLLYLCALLIGSLIVALRSLEKPQVDERAAPWILYGILIAVGVFLIHNLIEFSLFEPGALCLFAVLVGAALGMRLDNRPVRTPRIPPWAVAALAACVAGWLAAAIFIAAPVIRGEAAAHEGDDKLQAGDLEAASDDYSQAAAFVPFNADYSFRAARTLQMALGPPVPLTDAKQIELSIKYRDPIMTGYSVAIARDPAFLGAYHYRAIFELQLDEPDRMSADFEKVLALNPNEVSLRLEYAHSLQLVGRPAEARRQYELALHYDDLLDTAEPKRLAAQRRDEIEKLMASLPRSD
jgi:O-antigen ligase